MIKIKNIGIIVSWPHDEVKNQEDVRLGGQRMILLYCLSNVKKGGNTRFTRLKINVTPKAGRLLVFHNVYKILINAIPE